MLPPVFAIPELNALDDAPLAGQIDGPRCSAGRNLIANDQFFLGAVAEVHHNAFAVNPPSADAQLDGAEPAVVPTHVDVVVILAAIHMGVAEIVPTPLLRVQRDAERQD